MQLSHEEDCCDFLALYFWLLTQCLMGCLFIVSTVFVAAGSRIIPSINFGFPRTRTMSISSNPLRPLVFCGPSGVGKSTLVKLLMKEFPTVFGFSISHTTRKPREGEQDGREYHFVSRNEMEAAIRNGEFIESAEFSGNMYGTR